MYAFIRGYLAEKDQNSAVIDAGGVGYLLSISYSTYAALPELGEEVKLYSHLSVREDAMELFGFADREELSVFKMLITVSGVGPKAALAILSELSPGRFALAVSASDVKALTKAAGVGPKMCIRDRSMSRSLNSTSRRRMSGRRSSRLWTEFTRSLGSGWSLSLIHI